MWILLYVTQYDVMLLNHSFVYSLFLLYQEMPLNQLVFEEIGCAMVDSCPPYLSQEELFDVFMTNFYRHYNSNRAPLGLYFHSNWFKTKSNR